MTPTSSTDEGSPFPATGRYRPLGLLGRGGTGTVFRAHDQELARQVAVKVLHQPDVAAARSLRREFRAVADLRDANVARLFELELVHETPFFTMEVVDGIPITEWCRSQPSQIAPTFVQVLSGLRALHGAGIVHRDLKPSNVVVTTEGRAVILDFGFAAKRAVGAMRSAPGGLSGTPRYLPPEALMGRASSPAGDLYAVGLMMHEALGGKVPVSSSWAELVRWKRGRASLVPIEPDPTGLGALAQRMTSIDPFHRPSLDDALAALGGRKRTATLRGDSPRSVDDESRLVSALDLALVAGTSRVVRVEGLSGSGKSRLVSNALSALGDRVAVLAGRCHPSERVAYRALDQVVIELYEIVGARALAGGVDLLADVDPALYVLFPALAAVPTAPVHDVVRAVLALRRLLDALSRHVPTVIWIDDAQWADADSVALLRDVLAPPNDLAVVVLLSHRPGTLSPALEAMTDEVVRATPAASEPPPVPVPQLSQHGREWLERTAVAGRPVRTAELRSAEDRAALRELHGFDLVRLEGVDEARGYVVADAAVRARVLEELAGDAGAIAGHHRHLARGLLALEDARPEEIVVHLRAGGLAPEAYALAVRGAEQATNSLAFAAAVELCREALAVAPSEERAQRRRALGDALARAGLGESAAQEFRALASESPLAEAVTLELLAAEQLLFSGHQPEGLDAMEATFRRVGLAMPRSRAWAFARLMVRAIQLRAGPVACEVRSPPRWDDAEVRRVDVLHAGALGLSMSEAILSSAIGLDHLDAAVALGEPSRLCRAVAIQLAQLAAFRYDPAKTRALETQALALGDRAGDASALTLARIAAATAAWMEGRFEDAFVLTDRLATVTTETPGFTFHRDSAQIVRLSSILHTGRWRELGVLAPAALVDATRRGDLYLSTNVRVRFGGWRWLARDEPERGVAEIERASAEWPRASFDLTDLFALHGHASCLLYAGRSQEAVTLLSNAMPAARRSFLLSVGFLKTLVLDLRARATLAARAERWDAHARREVVALQSELGRVGSPLADAYALAIGAELAVLANELSVAAELLTRTQRAFDGLGMKMESASARVRESRLRLSPAGADAAAARMEELGARRPLRVARLFFPTLATR